MQDNHSIVSSEAEELILVDHDDNETGYLSKAKCHDGKTEWNDRLAYPGGHPREDAAAIGHLHLDEGERCRQQEHKKFPMPQVLFHVVAHQHEKIDVSGQNPLTDLFVVASGSSNRHVKSMAENLVMKARAAGCQPLAIRCPRASACSKP